MGLTRQDTLEAYDLPRTSLVVMNESIQEPQEEEKGHQLRRLAAIPLSQTEAIRPPFNRLANDIQAEVESEKAHGEVPESVYTENAVNPIPGKMKLTVTVSEMPFDRRNTFTAMLLVFVIMMSLSSMIFACSLCWRTKKRSSRHARSTKIIVTGPD